MADIQAHPAYHEGFFDALDGEPLFENECTAEYRAGWEAAHRSKQLFKDAGFAETAAGEFVASANLPREKGGVH